MASKHDIICIDDDDSLECLTLPSVPAASSSADAWPKQLPSITTQATCMFKGSLAGVSLLTAPLKIWHEIAVASKAAAEKPAAAGGKQTTLAFRKNKGGDGDGLTVDAATDLNVRFGVERRVANPTAPWASTTEMVTLGRLPRDLALPLSVLLSASLVTVSGNVVAAPDALTIGCDITLWLQLTLLPGAKRFMRCIPAAAMSADSSAALADTRFVSSPAELRVRTALFELIYFCVKGCAAPKPRVDEKKPTPAAASTSSSGPGGKASGTDGEEAIADNDEERMADADVQRLFTVAGTGGAEHAPDVAVARQPVGIRNITLRPYQRQALAWMLGRERNCEPVGDSVAAWQRGSHDKGDDGDSDSDTAAAAPVALSAAASARASTASAISSLLQSAVTAAGASASMAGSTSMWEQFHFQDNTVAYLNVYTRSTSLLRPPPVRPCSGGILADEMGLGKTCEVVSLIVAQKEARDEARRSVTVLGGSRPPIAGTKRLRRQASLRNASDGGEDDDDGFVPARSSRRTREAVFDGDDELMSVHASSEMPVEADEFGSLPHTHATLVVCPLTMMGQWKREIAKYTVGEGSRDAGLRVIIDYGSARARDIRELQRVDVVITSYGTLGAQYSSMLTSAGTGRSSTPPAYGVRWERVVLDEAHMIRNRTTRIAKACTDLSARYRWCLTGTPIQNSLQDLYSLFRFLRHEPWSELMWWKRIIAEPYERKDPRAMQALQAVLSPLLLRRTKNMVDVDGRKIGDLAPASIQIVKVTLAPEERTFYDALYHKSKLRFQGFAASGRLLAQYAAILSLLLRLRQACLHPYLVLGSTGGAKSTASSVIAAAAASSAPTSLMEGGDEGDALEVVDDQEAGFTAAFLQELYDRLLSRAPAAAAAPRSSRSILVPDAAVRPSSAVDEHHHSFLVSQIQTLSATVAGGAECPVCLDTLSKATSCMLVCGHLTCIRCTCATVASTRSCPVCKAALPAGKDAYVTLDAPSRASPSSHTSSVHHSIQHLDRHALRSGDKSIPWVSSSKLSLLLEHLTAIRAHNATVRQREQTAARASGAPQRRAATTSSFFSSRAVADVVESDESKGEVAEDNEDVRPVHGMLLDGFTKVVVFSFFTFMLDLVERVLRESGMNFTRLDGTMSQTAREAALARFRDGGDTFVMLMSLKAGGLGLNLTEANVVYVADPWFNPAAEHQALSRVHRFGQTKQVYVKRLIAADTIEESMLEIQAKKEHLAAAALSGGSAASAKLTEDDLVRLFRR